MKRAAIPAAVLALLAPAAADARPSLSLADGQAAISSAASREQTAGRIAGYRLDGCHHTRPYRVACILTEYDPQVGMPDDPLSYATLRVSAVRHTDGSVSVG